MNRHLFPIFAVLCSVTLVWTSPAFAIDCSDMPKWKRQHYYLEGAEVQYQENAYVNVAESSKRDFPDPALDYPWDWIGA